MATRSDIRVFFNLSPRLIVVDAPSIEVTIQDLHDTVRDIEDEPANLIYPDLISTAGKEDLGGGVSVGLTATLQNAQVAFERRVELLESGTVTTASTTGGDDILVLTDAAATFITNGVSRGDMVFNRTDESFGEVLEINSETELTVLATTGGTDDIFQIGDAYRVYKMYQCQITGGNLVAVDELQAELDPVFPTFGTQVVRTSSSSATLASVAELEFASFEGAVWVNPSSGFSGTDFPTGTPRRPVDNLTDAYAIALERGLEVLNIAGTVSVGTEGDWTNFTFAGENPQRTMLDFSSAAMTDGLRIFGASVTGELSGVGVEIREGVVTDLDVHSGAIIRSGLEGTISLTGGSTDSVTIVDSFAAGDGVASPVIDAGGVSPILTIPRYTGALEIQNHTNTNAVVIGAMGGLITLDSTVTSGTVVLTGQGILTDNSTGTTSVTNNMVGDTADISQSVVQEINNTTYDGVPFEDILADLLAMAKGRIVESPANTFTFYEQDNTTARFVLVKTGNERQRV